MLADQYDLPLSTASGTAREAYVQGSDLLLTLYPGAVDAFDRAIAADPGFALAHAAKAKALFMAADMPAAQTALAAANAMSAGLPAREASHLAFFGLLIAGQAEAALNAGRTHLESWPRDRMVANMCGSFAGLITFSGHTTRADELMALMDRLAPHYGDDWWFTTHHAMALIEAGRRTTARPMLERSIEQNPHNAWAAHTFAHFYYEDGDPHTARAFLSAWLPSYPKTAAFHGHLSWHLALGELEAGNADAALRLYHEAVALNAHSGPPRGKLSDGTSFLWRWELAGHPRDPAAWQAMLDFINQTFPVRGWVSPTCISRWPRRSPAMAPRSRPKSARWRTCCATDVTPPDPSCRRWHAPSPLSSGRISRRQSKRSSPSWTSATASAAAARKSM